MVLCIKNQMHRRKYRYSFFCSTFDLFVYWDVQQQHGRKIDEEFKASKEERYVISPKKGT